MHGKAICEAAIGFDHLRSQLPQYNALEIEDDAAGLDLFDVENVIDQPHQARAVAMGDAKESRHAVGQLAGGAAEQKTERTRDRCRLRRTRPSAGRPAGDR